MAVMLILPYPLKLRQLGINIISRFCKTFQWAGVILHKIPTCYQTNKWCSDKSFDICHKWKLVSGIQGYECKWPVSFLLYSIFLFSDQTVSMTTRRKPCGYWVVRDRKTRKADYQFSERWKRTPEREKEAAKKRRKGETEQEMYQGCGSLILREELGGDS